jgi:NADH:ubiquinone oxidoreductase subunit C
MLINLSNHPKEKWSEKQLSAAIKKYKQIVDIPFPYISPKANTKQVIARATKYYKQILDLLKSSPDKNNAVHLMGEFTFVYHLVNMLKKKKVKVLVSTTHRIVEEKDNKKIVTFDFVRFREY